MRRLIAPAALAAGLMLASAALAAAPPAATADSGTTTAAPIVREVVGRTEINAPIEQLTVSRPVSYAGLNLTNPADVKIVDQRINRTARQDCAQLRNQDPGDPTIQGGHCVRTAERDAKLSLNSAISAAGSLQ